MITPKRLPIITTRQFAGEVTLEDFVAFAEKKTWGQKSADQLLATGNFGTMMTLPPDVGSPTPGDVAVEENDESDGEDARC